MFYLQKTLKFLSEDDINIRKIIKAFEIIIKINILMKSQRYTYVEKFHEIILTDRQAYQNFIQYVINSAKNLNNENFNNENFRDEKNAVINADAISNENNVLQEILFDAVLNDDEENLKNNVLSLQKRAQIQKSFAKKKRGRKHKKDKYKKFLALFNVHVGLHLTDMARKYATIINLNVLSYEMKHM